jgi:hypothetical protein
MDITSISSGWSSSSCPACGQAKSPADPAEDSQGSTNTGESSNALNNKELTKEEVQEVTKLKKRDAEVKAHEAAHVAAGGQYVRGGARFEFETGPDGGKYAVGGEVPIDTSPVRGDTNATIRKMQVVKAAALAPAQPSGADRAIAAQASAEAAKAQAEIAKERQSQPAQGSNAVHGAQPLENQRLGDTISTSPLSQSQKSLYPATKSSPGMANIDIMA